MGLLVHNMTYLSLTCQLASMTLDSENTYALFSDPDTFVEIIFLSPSALLQFRELSWRCVVLGVL